MNDTSYISPFAHIRRPNLLRYGEYCSIDSFTLVTPNCNFGNWCRIGSHCSVIGGPKSYFTMQDCCGIGAGSRLICGSDDYSGNYMIGPTIDPKYTNITYGHIIMEKLTNLGTNVIVLPNVTISEGCIICADSMVTKTTEPWTIYYGTPARPMRTRNRQHIYKLYEQLCQEHNFIPQPLLYQ